MQAKRAWARLSALIVVLLVSTVWFAPVIAQGSAITLTARAAFQGYVRSGTWLPVLIEVANSGVDQTVEIVAGTPNGPFHSAMVDLPGGSRKGVTIYVYVTGMPRQLNVRLLANGEELASVPVRLQPVSTGLLVGMVGEREPQLPAQLADRIKLTSALLSWADVPVEGLGLSPFDALILTDPGATELTPAQQRSLQEWVLRGGTLIINGDTGIARTLSLLPAELAPVQPGRPLPSLDDPPLTPLELIPRSDETKREVSPLTLPRLASSSPLAFSQWYGEGQIIALAFDLTASEVRNWGGWRELWQAVLPPPSFVPEGMGFGAKLLSTFVEENLANALTSLPALDLPSINVLGLLLGCYLIVVGPVTYLVLRRFDRLALGWIVVPAITVIFAVIAYAVGFNMRGGDVIVSQLTLIDAIEPTLSRERKVIGIFSPDSSDYQLRINGEPALVRPISAQGPWSSGNLSNGRYLQATADGLVVEDLTVLQWSLQAIALDQIVASPGLEAQITVNGEDMRGTVTNRSNRALEEVVLVYGDNIAMIDQLAPGEQRVVQVERPPHSYDGASLGYIIYGPQFEESGRIGQPPPPMLQLRSRVLDVLYGYGVGTRGAQPLVMGWYSEQQAQVEPVGRRATMQQLALVRGTAQLQLSGEVKLTGGFASAIEQAGGMNSPCYAGSTLGVVPDVQPATIRFTLPRALSNIQLRELSLTIRSDIFWNGSIEVYDWTTGEWVSLLTESLIQNQMVSIDQPERFLNGNGAMRVRLQRLDQNQSFSCVYIDPVIRGRLP
ncbi:hypothetical protein [Chloroflexus sp.]|uniref:hypothetical protein n=1 Tax=Chloroflexus sp. TaxID=1904827 RepID=UPI002616BB63|nr:hypothetical protein [uncultured Chloroflexus sp.]